MVQLRSYSWLLFCILTLLSIFSSAQQRAISNDLSSYLQLTSQQSRDIVRINNCYVKNGSVDPSAIPELHRRVLDLLTPSQRHKLETIAASPLNEQLRSEAIALHLVDNEHVTGRGFGGTTPRSNPSRDVHENSSQTPPPAQPPQ